MPRGRKPAAAKMAAPEKPVTIKLTMEQLETLKKVSSLIGDARLGLHKIEDCETTSTMSFAAGKAFVAADQAEDLVDELIRQIDPTEEEDSWEDEDEDNY